MNNRMTMLSNVTLFIGFVAYENVEFVSWVNALRAQSAPEMSIKFFCKDNSESLEGKSLVEHACQANDILLHPDKGNIGYFAGLNRLIDTYRECDAFVLGNYDLIPGHEFLENVLNAFTHDQVDFIAPRVVQDGIVVPPLLSERSMGRGKLAFWQLKYSSYMAFVLLDTLISFLHEIANQGKDMHIAPDNNRTRIYCPHGSLFVISGRLIKRGFKLPEENFLWHEEYLLAEHCYRNDIPIWWYKNIEVEHKAHASTGRIVGRKKYNIMKKSFNNIIGILREIVASKK